ncbi:MAG: hypothetical protein SFY80_12195 [Verrucomicrobiota bacterium]|nr:hypothetical protein [Verrucomicrobiota bacterium]
MSTPGRRLRILYYAWTVPEPRGGACLAMYRHFIEHDDFELAVVSSAVFTHPTIPSLRIVRHPLLVRLSNTRFSRLFRQWEMLLEPCFIPSGVISFARAFRPDAVFTIPDNTLSWSACKLATRLHLPLITNFQDWWPRGQFTYQLERPYGITRSILEYRFREMYRRSALAFCTSDGMREMLGPHANAPTLYPCPAIAQPLNNGGIRAPIPGGTLRVVYAGTVINAYGRQLLRLARAIPQGSAIKLEIYGPHPDWSVEDLHEMTTRGIYCGCVSPAEIQHKLKAADICLVVMSFEQSLALMMRTSFTSKFLEYTQHGKPVVIWGPEYCQPVKVAQREQAAEVITVDEPAAVVACLQQLGDATRWMDSARRSRNAAEGLFSHHRIHGCLVESITQLLTVKETA